MMKRTLAVRNLPKAAIAPETTPLKWAPHMDPTPYSLTYNGRRNPYIPLYRERDLEHTWPYTDEGWVKRNRSVLNRWYSTPALQEALKMIPAGFETRDVPRPPQRIKAQSEGIVGRWYTNYWTLHSIRYQCQLANVPWRHGERVRPTTNFEEPYFFVDYEESKMIRDWRSRWINMNRSMVGMTKRVKEVEEENRYLKFKRTQDAFWTDRKVLVNRVKSMRLAGVLQDGDLLPVPTMKMRVFDVE